MSCREQVLERYKEITWKPWQQQVLDIVSSKPDNRSVYWFWEPNGNVGKSFLAKYLYLRYDAIFGYVSKQDMVKQLKSWRTTHSPSDPMVVVVDIPHSSKRVNYVLLETLKNGYITSRHGKDGRMVFRSPHIIVFAKKEPNYAVWSQDRYKVYKIE